MTRKNVYDYEESDGEGEVLPWKDEDEEEDLSINNASNGSLIGKKKDQNDDEGKTDRDETIPYGWVGNRELVGENSRPLLQNKFENENECEDYPVGNEDYPWASQFNKNGAGARAVNRDKKFLPDSYSFIALNNPFESAMKARFFLFGLLPVFFQALFLLVLLWSVTDKVNGTIGDTDNPEADDQGVFFARFVPAKASPIVRLTQVASITAYVIFPCSSLKDVGRSIQMFPRPSQRESTDPIACMVLSCVLRGLQGILASLAVFLLVITSEKVVDIILNFTAVNFISELDEIAFSLALSGEFGPIFRAEAGRILDKDLPPCMYKPNKHTFYRIVVLLISGLLFGFTGFVIYGQASSQIWATQTFRVQFPESTGLNEYSGCFVQRSMSNSRYSYESYRTNGSTFVYCKADRQWIFLEDNELLNDTADACNETELELLGLDLLARSPKTDTFDISSSFEESWISASNSLLSISLFDADNVTALHCESTLGDGICDQGLNNDKFDFDGGDCCAASCTQAKCGERQSVSVFESPSGFAELAFPYCEDSNMVPITIRLNDIKSNRDEQFFGLYDSMALPRFDAGSIAEEEWRMARPRKAFFSIECDDQVILTVYVDNTMLNKSETLMVNDGSYCTVVARNATKQSNIDDDSTTPDLVSTDPIWWINYTVFDGEIDDPGKIEIVTEASWKEETATFKKIPDCYFRKLKKFIGAPSHYKEIDDVTALLAKLDTKNNFCEEENFVERYTVTKVFSANNLTDYLTTTDNVCKWPNINCNRKGQVQTIRLAELQVPEILDLHFLHDLNGLKSLDINYNKFPDILPTEIGTLTSLKSLDLSNNFLEQLPSEIGMLKGLESLNLNYNRFSNFTREIGMLTSLKSLELNNNGFSNLTSEIGMLTSLESLDLNYNYLTNLSSGIGMMIALKSLDLSFNELESLPSEMGLLTNLKSLDLTYQYNGLKTLPSEIGMLGSLESLDLNFNHLVNMPSVVGTLTSLKSLDLSNNGLETLPREVQMFTNLSNLRLLDLSFNELKTLPSEIGMLKNIKSLDLTNNGLTNLPSEIGMLTSLTELNLRDCGKISFIPDEIIALCTANTKCDITLFTDSPSLSPSSSPSFSPSATPSASPSVSPSSSPSAWTLIFSPTTQSPATIRTRSPSLLDDSIFIISQTTSPTITPQTSSPSKSPTKNPTSLPTRKPTAAPTLGPTIPGAIISPTSLPTRKPTAAPTLGPTTPGATTSPTSLPTRKPTAAPTAVPTPGPTATPTSFPTRNPTASPTAVPTPGPTASPTKNPTLEPSSSQTTDRARLGCPENVAPLNGNANMQELVNDCLNNGQCWDDLPIKCWDTSAVKSMNNAFLDQVNFNEPLELWNTQSVTDMTGMFMGASSFNQPLGNFDTSKVTSMEQMFNGASSFNRPLDNFDTSSVTTMRDMFKEVEAFNQPLDNFDTSSVTEMNGMFWGASSFNQRLDNFDTSSVTTMRDMFKEVEAFNQPLDNFDTRSVTTMKGMFWGASSFNQGLDNFDTSSVTTMAEMFQLSSAFNQRLDDFDTSSVRSMRKMFYDAESFNQPLGNFDTSSVTDMRNMFSEAESFNQCLGSWDRTNANTFDMFYNSGCTYTNQANNCACL